MKKQLLSVSLAIAVLVIQPAVPAFAKEQPSIKTEQSCDTIETDTRITVNPQKITAGTLSFNRRSDSLGVGTLQVISSTTPSSMKATIRLQVKKNGTSTYKNASTASVTAKVTNKKTLTKSFAFKISTAKKYRVKATVVETINGNTVTSTFYKKLS